MAYSSYVYIHYNGFYSHKFEAAIAALPLMVAYIPMLMNTGGNCGSQSSVTVIRGLALNEIEIKDIFRVIRKEFLIALMVGFSLSVFDFFWIWLISGEIFSRGDCFVNIICGCNNS